MGITNIALLFPETGQEESAGVQVVVTDLGNDQFSISGPDSQVYLTDANHFRLDTSAVTLEDDGKFTAASG